MTVHTTVAPRVGERRRWFVIGAATLVAVVIGAVLALTLGGSGTRLASAAGSSRSVSSTSQGGSTMATIMALTPARFAAGALDYGYALPQVQHGATVAQVLASLSPSTRRYTKAVMSLSFAQLKAGAAGSP